MNVIDQERVVEILVPDVPSLGTGYLLGDGCVLTAYHVIQDYGKKGIQCRPLGSYNRGLKEWLVVKAPIWVNAELDLALLKVPHTPAVKAPWQIVKKLSLNQRIACRAYGFPKFRKRKLEGKSAYNAYVAEGWIPPLRSKDAGELLINIEGPPPREGMKGWQGISGSALFTEAEGCLVGVVLKGPDELGGNQLAAIALEHVIEVEPGFNQCLEAHFNHALGCLDEAADVAAAHDLHLTLETLKLQKRLSQISAANIDFEIERCERQLNNRPHRANLASEWSMLPEKQLQDLLVNIATSAGEIFSEVWHPFALTTGMKPDLDIEEVYLLLRGSMDRSRLDSFLIALYHQLEQVDRREFLEQLADLAQSVRQVDLTQISAPSASAAQPAIANPEQGSLLIKLESLGRSDVFPAQYAVSMWLAGNRQAYQLRFKASGTPISEASKATPESILSWPPRSF